MFKLHNYGWVYFDHNRIANILNLAIVVTRYPIFFKSKEGNKIIVQAKQRDVASEHIHKQKMPITFSKWSANHQMRILKIWYVTIYLATAL